MEKLTINDIEFEPKRTTLREWVQLDEVRLAMDDAISAKDPEKFYSLAVEFIGIASFPSKIEWDTVSWVEFLTAYFSCIEINKPTIKFPILENAKEKNEKPPWEYPGRSWYFWLGLFASNYGWNEQIIGGLDIDTAIGLYQELTINDQLEKEFTYSLSELAYPYNEKTKESNYKPMERPEWMKPIVQQPKPIRMKRSLLPMGNVIHLQDREKTKRGI